MILPRVQTNCPGSRGDRSWCREVWGRSYASQFFLYVMFSHMLFSREFVFCLFINYAFICTWMHVHMTIIERAPGAGPAPQTKDPFQIQVRNYTSRMYCLVPHQVRASHKVKDHKKLNLHKKKKRQAARLCPWSQPRSAAADIAKKTSPSTDQTADT